MDKKTLNLYEFQKLNHFELKANIEKILNIKVDDAYIKKIKDEINRINSKLKVKVVKPLYDSIQATQYVGFIRLKDFSPSHVYYN